MRDNENSYGTRDFEREFVMAQAALMTSGMGALARNNLGVKAERTQEYLSTPSVRSQLAKEHGRGGRKVVASMSSDELSERYTLSRKQGYHSRERGRYDTGRDVDGRKTFEFFLRRADTISGREARLELSEALANDGAQPTSDEETTGNRHDGLDRNSPWHVEGTSGTNMARLFEPIYAIHFDAKAREQIRELGYDELLNGVAPEKRYEALLWIMDDPSFVPASIEGRVLTVSTQGYAQLSSLSNDVVLASHSFDDASARYLEERGYGRDLVGLDEPESHEESSLELLDVIKNDPAFTGTTDDNGVLRVSLHPDYMPAEGDIPYFEFDDSADQIALAADNIEGISGMTIEEVLGFHLEEPVHDEIDLELPIPRSEKNRAHPIGRRAG